MCMFLEKESKSFPWPFVVTRSCSQHLSLQHKNCVHCTFSLPPTSFCLAPNSLQCQHFLILLPYILCPSLFLIPQPPLIPSVCQANLQLNSIRRPSLRKIPNLNTHHSHTRAYTCTQLHTHSGAHICTYSCTHKHAHLHTYTQECTHGHIYLTHTQTLMHTCTHECRHFYTYTRNCTHVRTHTRTMHKDTNTHTHRPAGASGSDASFQC